MTGILRERIKKCERSVALALRIESISHFCIFDWAEWNLSDLFKWFEILLAAPKLPFSLLYAKFPGFSTKVQTSRPGKMTRTNSLLFPGFSRLWEPWIDKFHGLHELHNIKVKGMYEWIFYSVLLIRRTSTLFGIQQQIRYRIEQLPNKTVSKKR